MIAVMHDLNLSAMFEDRVVHIREGRIPETGTPAHVLTDAALSTAYDRRLRVGVPPPPDAVFVLPYSASSGENELSLSQ